MPRKPRIRPQAMVRTAVRPTIQQARLCSCRMGSNRPFLEELKKQGFESLHGSVFMTRGQTNSPTTRSILVAKLKY